MTKQRPLAPNGAIFLLAKKQKVRVVVLMVMRLTTISNFLLLTSLSSVVLTRPKNFTMNIERKQAKPSKALKSILCML